MKHGIQILVGLAAITLLSLSGSPATAKEKHWSKYENAYFEAYSNASEKKVRDILEELENFRAAVAQILTFEIPAGAPKTQVVILRTERDFQKVTNDKVTGAFVIGLRGTPYVVMPAGHVSKWTKVAIRHEYTHVLMAYSKHRFPNWYQEGFAEFMSGTRFRRKSSKFTFGDANGRPLVRSSLVSWNTLTSDNFNFHSIKAGTRLSNAYYQSWLLVHFLMIGDNFAHYDDFGVFLGRYSKGESSKAAFEAVFGMTPVEIGNMVMQEYSRNTPYYEIDFEPGVQDHSFTRTEADATSIESTIAEIHELWVGVSE